MDAADKLGILGQIDIDDRPVGASKVIVAVCFVIYRFERQIGQVECLIGSRWIGVQLGVDGFLILQIRSPGDIG